MSKNMTGNMTGALLGVALVLGVTGVAGQQPPAGYGSETEAWRACREGAVWVDVDRKTYLVKGQRGYDDPQRKGTFMCRRDAESAGFTASNVQNDSQCPRLGQPLVPYAQRRC